MSTGRGEEQTCSMRQVTEWKLQTLTTAVMEIYGEKFPKLVFTDTNEHLLVDRDKQ